MSSTLVQRSIGYASSWTVKWLGSRRGFENHVDELEHAGMSPIRERDTFAFGGGQCIIATADALLGGSDSRKDGYAAGF
jgi:gamma-glutamyltranspeptidase